MADPNFAIQVQTTPSIPAKRPLEASPSNPSHAPSVSSPLNPNPIARPPSTAVKQREQREKKDSLKKREAYSAVNVPTSDSIPAKNSKKDRATGFAEASVDASDSVQRESPIRYNLVLPTENWAYKNKNPVWASHEPEATFTPDGCRELKRPADTAENKKHFRYVSCVADASFPHLRYFRSTDDPPFIPRFSFTDSDRWFHFDESGKVATNERGWRMGRANTCVREGTFYYEVKVLKGSPKLSASSPLKEGLAAVGERRQEPDDADETPLTRRDELRSNEPRPHVRVGFARREAPLDTPVGFDGYSYGMTDLRMEPMHKSRAYKYLDDGLDGISIKQAKSKGSLGKARGVGKLTEFAVNDDIRENDVIGLEITLPSLSFHRKIVDGSYNPAVDEPTYPAPHPAQKNPMPAERDFAASNQNILRDRYPVPYRSSMFFESLEYRSSRAMEAYGDRGPFSRETPNANHIEPTMRCLPGSSIRFYKNGRLIGTAFRDLMAFLPPASAIGSGESGKTGGGRRVEGSVEAGTGEMGPKSGQTAASRARAKNDGASGWREHDDGLLGYYPAVAVFNGGIAQLNLGPDFDYPPQTLFSRNSTTNDVISNHSLHANENVPVDADGDFEMIDVPQDGATAEESLQQQVSSEASRNYKGKEVPASRITDFTLSEARIARPMAERYVEQIAEDIVYDIVDEADFFVQDGGKSSIS